MGNGRYDSLSTVQMALLKQNTIDIVGDIDGGTVNYVRDAIAHLSTQGSPDIEVLITSNGGSVAAGLDVCDILSHYKGKKRGFVLCYAKSMAAVILQVCTHRRVAPHASILIHHVNRGFISLDELRNTKKLADVRNSMEKSQARLYQILTSRTGKDLKTIKKVCEKEEDMSAEEAKTFGLVDEIVEQPVFPPAEAKQKPG